MSEAQIAPKKLAVFREVKVSFDDFIISLYLIGIYLVVPFDTLVKQFVIAKTKRNFSGF